MKLLIVTQTVDKNDPVLGFFHRWIEEFAKQFEHIVVIGNSTGVYTFPNNVEVHSLGKFPSMPGIAYPRGPFERTVRSLRYLGLLWKLKDSYDVVLVHMTPEHLALGGPLLKLLEKKAFLWYNHTVKSPWLSFAAVFATRIFHTSPYAASAQFPQSERMPAGIDTELFKPDSRIKKIPKSVYFQGRIAPSKNVHILLEAFNTLYASGIASRLTLVGPEEKTYIGPLKKKYADLIQKNAIVFLGTKSNDTTPDLYRSHMVSVNLTDRGNYDKTVLESLACGTPCVVSSDAFSNIVPDGYRLATLSSDSLAQMLAVTLAHPTEAVTLRSAVVEQHSLPYLARTLLTAVS